MKKKVLVLTLASLLSVSMIAFAGENPDNIAKSKACVEQAREFTRKSDFVNAEKKLNEAIKLNNKNDEAYFNLGRYWGARKDSKRAVEYFSKAISINPQKDEYYVLRATEEMFLYDLKSSIKDFNKAIEINPKNMFAYIALGTLHGKYGYFKEALDYFNKAEEYSDGAIEDLYVYRSEVKVYSKDYTGAIEDLKKALTIAKKKNDQKLIVSLNEKIKEIQAGMDVFK